MTAWWGEARRVGPLPSAGFIPKLRFERIGTEQVDGVATTHFKVNYDWEKALKDLPDDRRKTIETALTTNEPK